MATLGFTKMHGCGNDFIVFADPENQFSWDELGALARRVCPRRFSIGADGIIAVGTSALPDEVWPDGADYEMRYVNADGSRAEMCGNGIRCLGRFVAEELGETRRKLQVVTGAGLLPISLLEDASGAVTRVSVGMGIPGLNAEQVPTTLGSAEEQVISAVLDLGDERIALTGVSMGNPHAVAFVDAISDYHIETLGPQVETHEAFPSKTNVEFIEVRSPVHLRMRVWERGVGETWACGTGACASVVAAVLNGHSKAGTQVTVTLNGGDLEISWPGEGQPVQMTGPAEIAFRGELGT